MEEGADGEEESGEGRGGGGGGAGARGRRGWSPVRVGAAASWVGAARGWIWWRGREGRRGSGEGEGDS